MTCESTEETLRWKSSIAMVSEELLWMNTKIVCFLSIDLKVFCGILLFKSSCETLEKVTYSVRKLDICTLYKQLVCNNLKNWTRRYYFLMLSTSFQSDHCTFRASNIHYSNCILDFISWFIITPFARDRFCGELSTKHSKSSPIYSKKFWLISYGLTLVLAK